MAPEASADWDIIQTVSWIIYRGSPAPAELNEDDERSALESVNNAVRTSKLPAWGRPSLDPEPLWHQPIQPRERIPAHVIDERRQINMSGRLLIISSDEAPFDFLRDRGPWFYEVRFWAADVLAVWPAPSEQPSETDEAPDTTTAAEGQTTTLVAQTPTGEGATPVIPCTAEQPSPTPAPVRSSSVPAATPEPLAVDTPPHPRRNYTKPDTPLIAVMHRLLTRKHNRAKNVTDAARQVVKIAQGEGTDDSKVKRLVRRYYQIHPQGTADLKKRDARP